MVTADPYLDAARRAMDRTRAEIGLIAALAESPRRSLEIAKGMGIGRRYFLEPDTEALFLAVEFIADEAGPANRERLMHVARAALKLVGCWDETSTRKFVTVGYRWGHESLAALLARVPFDPETVRRASLRLLAFGAGVA